MAMDNKSLKLVLFLLFSNIFLLSIEAAQKGSLITKIPGFNGKFPSNHYSGYVSFEEKNLFYYFVVSERNPVKDPVVLWLNGGPGCSSFDGFVYEHGPFNFQEGQPKGSGPTLHLNPYSWSKVSNIIYLDSPCAVGLSYSKNVSKYTTGDIQTAVDTHTFLLKWFELYPEFVRNPFYISGESYAGIYVPTLSFEVVKGIKAGQKPIINFKGYLVGNGASHSQFDGINALIPFAHGMGLISDDIFQEIGSSCKENYYNPTTNCEISLDKLDRSDEVATRWLNDESVRKAIHAEPKSIAGPWELCSSRIDYEYGVGSMIPYHKSLTSQGYRALIYSGDHDMCVPFTGTQAWTRSLGYKVVDEWRPWISNDQVAGYLQGYDKNLIFLTIKGAGHTVPEYKPQESLDFYTRWLDGKPI
ncbi:serine carboxypeptidase 1-like isoform X2 [Euphorbia lathyris]|uniref:serine carboxypeptidase 1-like isoform X2 n=1 Tax=Euphorbia lathyris TaxID=212925 RepID=UPI003313EF0E